MAVTWKKLAYFTDIAATKLDDFATPDDVTDLNATNARHGLLLKLIDDVTRFLRSDGSWQVPAGAGATLTIAETNVYNATPPGVSAWTDLDLSSVVGSNSALVILKIAMPSTADIWTAVRKDGDTDEFYSVAGERGCSLGFTTSSNVYIVLITPTSSVGVIEWKTSYTGASNVIIDVIAYIK